MKGICYLLGMLILCMIPFYSGCLNESSKIEVSSGSSQLEKDDKSFEKQKHVQEIFYSLPSPLELSQLFKQEGIRYNKELLHNNLAREEYNTSIKKALNLGVYGADLSYSGLYSNHQAAIEYFTSCQLLAADLGMGSAFQSQFISRLEENSRNKDTLMQVVNDFFYMSDKELKRQNLQDISTYIIAGGWIEGMYLGISMTSVSTDMNGIKELVFAQKKSLHNLIYLLQNVEQNPQSTKLTNDIGQLEILYNQTTSEGDTIQFTNDHFLQIKNKVIILREAIIAY